MRRVKELLIRDPPNFLSSDNRQSFVASSRLPLAVRGSTTKRPDDNLRTGTLRDQSGKVEWFWERLADGPLHHNRSLGSRTLPRATPVIESLPLIVSILLKAGGSYVQQNLAFAPPEGAADIWELILANRRTRKVWLGSFQLLNPPGVGVSGSNVAELANDATGAIWKLRADSSSDPNDAELARRHSSRLLGTAGTGQQLVVAGPVVQDMHTRLLSANLDFDSELQHVFCWEPDECCVSRVSR